MMKVLRKARVPATRIIFREAEARVVLDLLTPLLAADFESAVLGSWTQGEIIFYGERR